MKLKNHSPSPPPPLARASYASHRSSWASIVDMDDVDFEEIKHQLQQSETIKMELVGGDNKEMPQQPYQMSISLPFLILTLLGTVALPFLFGCLARDALLLDASPSGKLQDAPLLPRELAMPRLAMIPHKKVPHTSYTTKNYDTARSVSSEALLDHREVQDEALPSEEINKNISFVLDNEEKEEIHEPAGQHLLVDMQGVDGAFLNSEAHLAKAMVELIQSSGLTMLSYHCHRLMPAGVSCAGVLLESHVSFHTWPVQGVITLDLFTCGPSSLVPLLDDIQRLFGRSPTPDSAAPRVVWSYKRRGFHFNEGFNPGISDLYATLLGVMQYERKEKVAFVQTEFQEVEIFDVLEPSSGNHDDGEAAPRWDRRVYLDGVLQSRRFGEAAYHEALVHPGMLVHPNPTRVAIIGGGEGSVLREVLKHSTVKEVYMIEIDAMVVELSKAWLEEWSDCSDLELEPPVKNCFDDPRVQVFYDDAVEWFGERYGPNRTMESPLFDVIVMDALNPEDEVNFSEALFDDNQWPQVIHDSLTPEHGMLAVRMGEAHSLGDAADLETRGHHAASFLDHLGNVGFHTIKEYEESHEGILKRGPMSFALAFKNYESVAEWYHNEAWVNLKIRQRIVRTKSGQPSLRHFDGATMRSYHYASRASEELYCRDSQQAGRDMCRLGHGFDPERLHDPSGTLRFQDYLLWVAEPNDKETTDRRPAYNPYDDRNALSHSCASDITLRDIDAGEEVLINHLIFASTGNWKSCVQLLNAESLKEFDDYSPDFDSTENDSKNRLDTNASSSPPFEPNVCPSGMLISRTGECFEPPQGKGTPVASVFASSGNR